MSDIEWDQAFLRGSFERIVQPLSALTCTERMLFSLGLGLGLGDQFMCRPLVSVLHNRFQHARIDLLTDFPDFWKSRCPASVRVLSRAHDNASGVLDILDSGYEAALLGYHPGCLDELSAVPIPTVFCAGTNLAQFRAFYASEGVCRELTLPLCRSALSECDRFVALFQDFGMRDPRESAWPSKNLARLPLATPVSSTMSELLVLIHPGTGKSYKSWPAEKWSKLAANLIEAGVNVEISSGVTEEDRRLAETIGRAAPKARVCPRLSLDAFLERLGVYDLVLSADTFLPHAVAAQGRSISLAVYGPTDPVRYCPPGMRNFFLAPLEIGSDAFLDAIQGILYLVSGNSEALARPRAEAVLRQTSHHLLSLAQKPTVSRSVFSKLLDIFRESIRERYRPVLVGDEAHRLRMEACLEQHTLAQALDSPIVAPVLRAARYLVAGPTSLAPIAHAGCERKEDRRVESI